MNRVKTLLKLLTGRGSMRSYSQFGEDTVIATWLKKIEKGTYVDVGAYHPTLYSNTYALYRRGWSGIVIDPNKDLRRSFATFRPRDLFINAGIGATTEKLVYHRYRDGAYNTLDSKWAEALAARGMKPIARETVPVQTLAEVIRASSVSRVDFMNIDVEGMDDEVLRSYDWKIRPYMLAVEIHGFDPDNPQRSPAYAYLRERGYVLVGLAGLTTIFKDEQPKTKS